MSSNFIKSRLLESVSRILGDEYKLVNEAPSELDPEGTSQDLQAEPELAEPSVPVEEPAPVPVEEPSLESGEGEVVNDEDTKDNTEFVSKEVFNKVVEAMSNMKSAMEVLASEVINLKKKNESIVSILNKVNDKFISIDKDDASEDKALAALADKVNQIGQLSQVKESAVISSSLASRCTDILDSTYKVSTIDESAPIVEQSKTELGEMLLQYQARKSSGGFVNDSIHAADILG